jgi:hypothetical protein
MISQHYLRVCLFTLALRWKRVQSWLCAWQGERPFVIVSGNEP